MNDRYLYRAKRKNWRELPKEMWWVQGYLYGIWERRYILWGMTNDVPDMIEVDPSTICQCTGLNDKNGNPIFENDIVKYHFGEKYARIKYGVYQSCFDSTKTGHCGFYVDWPDSENKRKDLGYWINMVDAEIAGNIFDNPELLEVGK